VWCDRLIVIVIHVIAATSISAATTQVSGVLRLPLLCASCA